MYPHTYEYDGFRVSVTAEEQDVPRHWLGKFFKPKPKLAVRIVFTDRDLSLKHFNRGLKHRLQGLVGLPRIGDPVMKEDDPERVASVELRMSTALFNDKRRMLAAVIDDELKTHSQDR